MCVLIVGPAHSSGIVQLCAAMCREETRIGGLLHIMMPIFVQSARYRYPKG